MRKIVLQSFGGRPTVFVTAKYSRSTKPKDAVYVWLENLESRGFEVCIREFLPFDGKHQDTIVVGRFSDYRPVLSGNIKTYTRKTSYNNGNFSLL